MPGDAVVYSPEIVVDSRADDEAIRKRVAAAMDAANRQLAARGDVLHRAVLGHVDVIAIEQLVRAQARNSCAWPFEGAGVQELGEFDDRVPGASVVDRLEAARLAEVHTHGVPL